MFINKLQTTVQNKKAYFDVGQIEKNDNRRFTKPHFWWPQYGRRKTFRTEFGTPFRSHILLSLLIFMIIIMIMSMIIMIINITMYLI